MQSIELTSKENELYKKANSISMNLSYDERIACLEAQRELCELLLQRDIIPQNRISYFTERKYQTGNLKKSRQKVFEDNGCKGKDIFEHPHFLKYLNYFIHGADIERNIYDEVNEIYENILCEEDAVEKSKILLRKVKPKELNQKMYFITEVFKMCVDIGFLSHSCHSIRKYLMT